MGRRDELITLLPVHFPDNAWVKDSLVWEWDPKQKFSVRNAYQGSTTEVFNAPLPKSSGVLRVL